MRKERGITIIALIAIIAVIVVIVGVGISVLTNDDKKDEKANTNTSSQGKTETVTIDSIDPEQLEETKAQVQHYLNNGGKMVDISFTIDGTKYYAKFGMEWDSWIVDENYNLLDAIMEPTEDGEYIYVEHRGYLLRGNELVKAEEKIIENAEYTLSEDIMF